MASPPTATSRTMSLRIEKKSILSDNRTTSQHVASHRGPLRRLASYCELGFIEEQEKKKAEAAKLKEERKKAREEKQKQKKKQKSGILTTCMNTLDCVIYLSIQRS